MVTTLGISSSSSPLFVFFSFSPSLSLVNVIRNRNLFPRGCRFPVAVKAALEKRRIEGLCLIENSFNKCVCYVYLPLFAEQSMKKLSRKEREKRCSFCNEYVLGECPHFKMRIS